MARLAAVPEQPPAHLLYRRRLGLLEVLRDLWQARELIRTLVERELLSRYKQAVFGAAWAIIPPLTLMIVFTLFLHRAGRIDTQGIPYPLFSYIGLLPWSFFSSSVSRGGTSLIQNAHLLNKVYCPREVFPMSSVAVSGIDTLVALPVLALLFVVNRTNPAWTTPLALPLILILVAFTLAVTMVVSALTVYVRDVRHALPILLQFGLFATPVAYGSNVVPERFRLLYAFINPLAPVIDGLRRVVLLGQPPHWDAVAAGSFSALLFLLIAYALFKRWETGIADVA
jgi:ABC-2 type transport system permease protein/lipopolysaccharide transport system permease protein